MQDDLFCKLFLNTDRHVEDVLDIICFILKGRVELIRTIKSKEADIDLRINKEFNQEKSQNKHNGFLYWRYFLDIEPTGCQEIEYISHINDLINGLKKHGMEVVAACDFEERLHVNYNTTLNKELGNGEIL